MNRKTALFSALFAFLLVACTGDPAQEDPSNPEHINPGSETQDPDPDPDPDPDHDPQDSCIVDLGLSIKWASCNLGASKPQEYGDYYAWAEIEPYYSSLDPLTWKEKKPDGYAWTSYSWAGETSPLMKKYCPSNTTIYWGKEGEPDNKGIIDPEDDAATVKLGSAWRIPTEDEWKELMDKCKWTWTALEGVDGFVIAAENGNSIFLPAAGTFNACERFDAGSLCGYWSSTLNKSLPDTAIILNMHQGYGFTASSLRYNGYPIRPVID